MCLGYIGETCKKKLGDSGYIQENWDASYLEHCPRPIPGGSAGGGRGVATWAVCCNRVQWDTLSTLTHKTARPYAKGTKDSDQQRHGTDQQSLDTATSTLSASLCDIPSGCCFFTGPWTVSRSSLRMLRRVAAFCQPLRPVLLLLSFPRSQSPVVGVLGLCWMWQHAPSHSCPPVLAQGPAPHQRITPPSW